MAGGRREVERGVGFRVPKRKGALLERRDRDLAGFRDDVDPERPL